MPQAFLVRLAVHAVSMNLSSAFLSLLRLIWSVKSKYVAVVETISERFRRHQSGVIWRGKPTEIHYTTWTNTRPPGGHGLLLSEDGEQQGNPAAEGSSRTLSFTVYNSNNLLRRLYILDKYYC